MNPFRALFSSGSRLALPIMADDVGARSFQKDQRPLTPEDEQKRRVQEALWTAFPEARSETDLARLAAAHFTSNGRKVSRRTVRYWLRGETFPDFMHARALTRLVGPDHFYREDDKE